VKKEGWKVNVTGLKKPNFFADRKKSQEEFLHGREKEEDPWSYNKLNKQMLKEFFRKKNVVQPYLTPELSILPLARLDEQSKIDFDLEKLPPDVRKMYNDFVERKVDVPMGQALEVANRVLEPLSPDKFSYQLVKDDFIH
jgi:hypothetical protein